MMVSAVRECTFSWAAVPVNAKEKTTRSAINNRKRRLDRFFELNKFFRSRKLELSFQLARTWAEYSPTTSMFPFGRDFSNDVELHSLRARCRETLRPRACTTRRSPPTARHETNAAPLPCCPMPATPYALRAQPPEPFWHGDARAGCLPLSQQKN